MWKLLFSTSPGWSASLAGLKPMKKNGIFFIFSHSSQFTLVNPYLKQQLIFFFIMTFSHLHNPFTSLGPELQERAQEQVLGISLVSPLSIGPTPAICVSGSVPSRRAPHLLRKATHHISIWFDSLQFNIHTISHPVPIQATKDGNECLPIVLNQLGQISLAISKEQDEHDRFDLWKYETKYYFPLQQPCLSSTIGTCVLLICIYFYASINQIFVHIYNRSCYF